MYSDNGINNGVANMYIEDETTGNWLSSAFTSINTNPGNASKSAEWIIEGKCCGLNLANFGTWYLQNDYYVRNGSGHYVGSSTHDYAVMCNGGIGNPCSWPGTKNAHPGGIVGGNQFPVYWDHA